MQSHQFTVPGDAVAFILAGNSKFTLVSERTGTRYTYRLRQAEDNPDLYFLSLLAGPDNENDYVYIGLVKHREYRWTTKVRLQPDSKPILAFCHAWKYLGGNRLPPACQVWHEGRCGKCHKTLTVPESIARGIGPDCAAHLGVA